MSAVQLLAAAFAVGMMYQSFLNFKKKDLTWREIAFWEAIWTGLLIVSIFPAPLQRLVGVAHVARLLDLVVIVGMLVFGLVSYQLYVSSRRLAKALDNLVRSDALAQLHEAGQPD